jgi:ubiquinone/menaquinone biosynthesis C-methylase UbiE
MFRQKSGAGIHNPAVVPPMRKNDFINGYYDHRILRVLEEVPVLLPVFFDTIIYPPGSRVLDAACGPGVQTCYLAQMSPAAQFTGLDIARSSIIRGARLRKKSGIRNIRFKVGDIFDLPFEEESFDHVIFTFGIEYVKNPEKAIQQLKKVLRPGGTITLLASDFGSFMVWPDTSEILETWDSFTRIHELLGGDSYAGRKIHPLLATAGFRYIHVTPVPVYCDAENQDLRDRFIGKALVPIIDEMKPRMIKLGLVSEKNCNSGIRDLITACGSEATFSLTFFRGIGVK